MSKVLVVEDDAPLREMIAAIVQRLGVECDAFPDAEAAIAAFNQDPKQYPAVIMDIRLPGMSGDQAVSIMKQTNPELHVLFSTGLRDQTNTEELKAQGDYIAKDWTPWHGANAILNLLTKAGMV